MNGYVKANTASGQQKLTDSEAADLFDWLEADNCNQRVLSTQTYWWEGAEPIPLGVVTFTA